MILGFFFVLLIVLWSISPLFEWINAMQMPRWITGIMYIVAFVCWICAITFLYHAEKAVFSKKSNM